MAEAPAKSIDRRNSPWQRIPRTPATGYVAALGAVALVGVLLGLLTGKVNTGSLSMLYLIPVLALATAFGSGPAVLASIAAFVTFNWFFIEPLHTLNVADPGQWLALLLFLLTAVVTGQLAGEQRRRARQAERRERDAVVLYDVVRLMSEPDLDRALHAVAERLRQELRLAGVAIDLGNGDDKKICVEVGEADSLLCSRVASAVPSQLLAEGAPPTGERRGAPGRWVRVVPPHPLGPRLPDLGDRLHAVPVKAGDRKVGTLLLVRPPDGQRFGEAEDRLLSAVATQLGLAVERARLRREATEAEVLRRADELKSALLGAVSHDLRTPLASIIASAGSLLQQDVEWTAEERREFAEAIDQAARRLNRLVGNLLDLSRIQGGSLRPEKGWYDLGALVDDVLGSLRQTTARHRVVVRIPEELPPVALDYVQISQALTNLVENAAKYCPAGSDIEIAARTVGDEMEIEVADRGPGVPDAELERLFQPFYRREKGGISASGAGLGLAIARGLVEAHGGRIWAENRPGGGTRFLFRLPMELPSDKQSNGEL
jgi:two-component system sensor histidine kinase KdpD